MAGEGIASQHRMVVSGMTLVMKKMKRTRVESEDEVVEAEKESAVWFSETIWVVRR